MADTRSDFGPIKLGTIKGCLPSLPKVDDRDDPPWRLVPVQTALVGVSRGPAPRASLERPAKQSLGCKFRAP